MSEQDQYDDEMCYGCHFANRDCQCEEAPKLNDDQKKALAHLIVLHREAAMLQTVFNRLESVFSDSWKELVISGTVVEEFAAVTKLKSFYRDEITEIEEMVTDVPGEELDWDIEETMQKFQKPDELTYIRVYLVKFKGSIVFHVPIDLSDELEIYTPEEWSLKCQA